MGFTTCWLHTNSLMPSHFISLKYAADNYAAGLETQFSQKVHQGWKEVLLTSSSDPAAKTILGHSDDGSTSQFSRSPLATSPSHDRSSSTSQTGFRPVIAKEPSPVSTLFGASPRFSSPHRRARRSFPSLLPNRTQTRHASLQNTGASALKVDYGANHATGNSFRVGVLSSDTARGRLDIFVGF